MHILQQSVVIDLKSLSGGDQDDEDDDAADEGGDENQQNDSNLIDGQQDGTGAAGKGPDGDGEEQKEEEEQEDNGDEFADPNNKVWHDSTKWDVDQDQKRFRAKVCVFVCMYGWGLVVTGAAQHLCCMHCT